MILSPLLKSIGGDHMHGILRCVQVTCPGTRPHIIHTERELVIREAVAKLAQLGLVETRPQSGTYVSDFQTSEERLIETLGLKETNRTITLPGRQ